MSAPTLSRSPPLCLRIEVTAEPAGERHQSDHTHAVVAVGVEVPQVVRVTLLTAERAEEAHGVDQVPVAVGVAVSGFAPWGKTFSR